MRRETIIKLETNLDHLTGEELGMALSALNDMPEVLDALCLHGTGKKNRPCCLLQVLCRPGHEEIAFQAIFRHTHTLGIRVEKIERVVLPREAGEENVQGETVAAKFYAVEKQDYSRPEADAIQKLARLRRVGAPALRLARK